MQSDTRLSGLNNTRRPCLLLVRSKQNRQVMAGLSSLDKPGTLHIRLQLRAPRCDMAPARMSLAIGQFFGR